MLSPRVHDERQNLRVEEEGLEPCAPEAASTVPTRMYRVAGVVGVLLLFLTVELFQSQTSKKYMDTSGVISTFDAQTAKPSWRVFLDLQCPFSKVAYGHLPALWERFGKQFDITIHYTSLAFHPQAFTAQCAAVLIGRKVSSEARTKFEAACFDKQTSYMNKATTDDTKADVAKIFADIAESSGSLGKEFTREQFLKHLNDYDTVVMPAYEEVKEALRFGVYGSPQNVICGKLVPDTESAWGADTWAIELDKLQHGGWCGKNVGQERHLSATELVLTTTAYVKEVSDSKVAHLHGSALEADQHIYIVRHGDKSSSYPDCPGANGTPCYNASLVGDNAPLTECGAKQAEHTAKWLQEKGIAEIVVSPFTRTLQTALPLAKLLGKQLNVEYLLSEANQPEGPHRQFNILGDDRTLRDLEEIQSLWNLNYGSAPIATPEDPALYVKRVARLPSNLKKRFPASVGNLAVYTHATTSFSLAYGLCYGDAHSDEKLQSFVEKQNAIGAAGVIHVVLGADGRCKRVEQTNNVAKEVNCGSRTDPYKCEFSKYPSWYWACSLGKGPGHCA